MDKLVELLNDRTRYNIVKLLTNTDATYTELLQLLPDQDSGRLNYHLKKLSNSGIIAKEDNTYLLTAEGEHISPYLRQTYKLFPTVSVCVAIFNEHNELLMIKRDARPFKGRWAVPGGTIYSGETMEEAAKRYAKEEIGVTVEVENVQGTYPIIVHSDEGIYVHTMLVYVKAKLVEGTPKPALRTSEVRFMRKMDVFSQKIIPGNEQPLEDLFNVDHKPCFKESVVSLY